MPDETPVTPAILRWFRVEIRWFDDGYLRGRLRGTGAHDIYGRLIGTINNVAKPIASMAIDPDPDAPRDE